LESFALALYTTDRETAVATLGRATGSEFEQTQLGSAAIRLLPAAAGRSRDAIPLGVGVPWRHFAHVFAPQSRHFTAVSNEHAAAT